VIAEQDIGIFQLLGPTHFAGQQEMVGMERKFFSSARLTTLWLTTPTIATAAVG
jgi:hypothetical protein